MANQTQANRRMFLQGVIRYKSGKESEEQRSYAVNSEEFLRIIFYCGGVSFEVMCNITIASELAI
jgi:hypothetical protein